MSADNVQMVKQLKALFENVRSVSADHAERLLALLDRAPQEALQMLVDERVKFCWVPAARRLREKFGVAI